MPKKKKTAMDMTTEELAKRIFPKKVRDKLKAVAHEKDITKWKIRVAK